ncbi:CotH kinase family protein [Desulfoplanes formicivorans]|uniref:LTD domain-containing protein n=1 Tax=Desulfoplanes formicivorans TaxID=1592317 RepID=A0A194AD88_9BACT|nr:CotH kinase family protein [Desulfoplanes formicivorans]GAU07323.1 hypothetical protein DPF_0001 [Desulfoplanes formicivorans]
MKIYFINLFILFSIIVSSIAEAQHIVINEIFVLGKGKRPDWIELYNSGNATCDIGGFTLSDNNKKIHKWTIPKNTFIRPGGFVLFFADKKNVENHTNFKLDAGGEYVGLYDQNGQCVDSITYNKFPAHGSLGRYPDGSKKLFFFTAPTMGSPNVNTSPTHDPFGFQQGPAPNVFPQGGHYNGPQQVIIQTHLPQARVFYTLDGSLPTTQSSQYSGPLTINTTTVLRCIAVDGENHSSAINTQTFLINEHSTRPIISLVTDPRNLWNEETGIYVKGNQWKRANYNKDEYNWKQSWKRTCNFEFFPKKSDARINIPCTIKIFGGASRNLPQKSFSIKVIDPKTDVFAYPFFPQKNIQTFKSIILRNSGDDWKQTMFRDLLMHTVLQGRMNIDFQAGTPALVFLNGTYWGIYNIREKLDPYYVIGNHHVDPEHIDMIKCFHDIKAGSDSQYNALISFIRSHDLSNFKHYKTVCEQIDIDEFINYQLAQIYYDNCDWPQNNIAWWREKKDNGKWRWILYDTDEGFQFHDKRRSCARNTLKWATKTNRRETLIFNALLKNENFRNRFLQIFAAHMSTTFDPARIIAHIDKLQNQIRPEMPRHINRWGAISSMQKWEQNVDELRRFARKRPAHVYEHLIKQFHLSGTIDLTLTVNDPHKGQVRMATVDIPPEFSNGKYFQGIPMTLHAIPASGHKFIRWEGLIQSTSREISFTPHKPGTIRAIFR